MLSVCIVLASLLATPSIAAVVELTPSNFDDFVGSADSKPALVEFFAPWCGHCKALAPEYEVVGSTFGEDDGVLVAKVDADAHRELGSRFGVTGFPTLKWFPAGSSTPEDYNGGRTADDIVEFINGKAGTSKRIKKEPTAVEMLSEANFDAVVMDPEADVLVEFFAPWCGHCKALKPTYEQVAKAFEAEDKVVVAAIDATAASSIAGRYDVKGYPTIKFFPKGSSSKTPEDYEGSREAGAFVGFLNAKAGTMRTDTGALAPNAGRFDLLDVLARRFLSASASDRSGVVAEAEKAVEELGGEGKYYVKAMGRIVAKGDGWVAKESARLEGMISSSAVSAARKTGMMLRRNVLSAFATDGSDEL